MGPSRLKNHRHAAATKGAAAPAITCPAALIFRTVRLRTDRPGFLAHIETKAGGNVRQSQDSNQELTRICNAGNAARRVPSTVRTVWHRTGDASDLGVALQISFIARTFICESLRTFACDLLGINRNSPPTTPYEMPP